MFLKRDYALSLHSGFIDEPHHEKCRFLSNYAKTNATLGTDKLSYPQTHDSPTLSFSLNEPRYEKTNNMVSDQVRHKPAVQI